jgi:cell division protein FtsB
MHLYLMYYKEIVAMSIILIDKQKKKKKKELEGYNSSRTKEEVQIPDDTNSLLPLVDKSYYIEEIHYKIDNTNITY